MSQIDKKKKELDKDVDNFEETKKTVAGNLEKKNKEIEEKLKEIDRLKQSMHEVEKQIELVVFEK